MTTNIVAFIIVLGVLIFFHELGHFLFARLCGVGVEKFSLGFGPAIVRKKIGRTDYRISAVPLGGYVKMVGEEPDRDIKPQDIPFSFTHKRLIIRIIIVAAGPLFNILLATVIFFGLFQVYGKFVLEPIIGEVQKDKPAFSAGLEKGDRIIAVDGKPVDLWEDMAEMIGASDGKSITITFLRNHIKGSAVIKPELKVEKLFGVEVKRYLIGIRAGNGGFVRRLNPLEASGESLIETGKWIKRIIIGITRLISGNESVKSLGGPILIAQMAGHHAEQGPASLAFYIAIISIHLAILNFLPIPVLDGGHLFFFFIEAVIRRPVSEKVHEIAQQAGIFILVLLTVFVFYNDLARIFFS